MTVFPYLSPSSSAAANKLAMATARVLAIAIATYTSLNIQLIWARVETAKERIESESRISLHFVGLKGKLYLLSASAWLLAICQGLFKGQGNPRIVLYLLNATTFGDSFFVAGQRVSLSYLMPCSVHSNFIPLAQRQFLCCAFIWRSLNICRSKARNLCP